MTAKTFGVRPSDYLPELGTWERYCFDELVAVQMAIEEQKHIEEAKKQTEGDKGKQPASGAESRKPHPGISGAELLNHEAFRKQ